MKYRQGETLFIAPTARKIFQSLTKSNEKRD